MEYNDRRCNGVMRKKAHLSNLFTSLATITCPIQAACCSNSVQGKWSAVCTPYNLAALNLILMNAVVAIHFVLTIGCNRNKVIHVYHVLALTRRKIRYTISRIKTQAALEMKYS